MVYDPSTVQQAAESIDYLKLGSLVLASYASVLSTVNFLSDRIRRIGLHIELRDHNSGQGNVVRVFIECKSGTVLLPEIDLMGRNVQGSASVLKSIEIGESLRKGDLRVFDQSVDAFRTYDEIWVEASGYKTKTKSNTLRPTKPN